MPLLFIYVTVMDELNGFDISRVLSRAYLLAPLYEHRMAQPVPRIVEMQIMNKTYVLYEDEKFQPAVHFALVRDDLLPHRILLFRKSCFLTCPYDS